MPNIEQKAEILDQFSNYLNRELSLIEFNYRVLLEAQDKNHPILERLKFITILSSNLDEFFMIRIAGLKNQIKAGVGELSYDGKTPQTQLIDIRKKLIPIYRLQEKILNEEILPELASFNIRFLRYDELDEYEIQHVRSYFIAQILPILTPLVLDTTHPFPRLIERSLNIAFILKDPNSKDNEQKLAFIQIPNMIGRLFHLDKRVGFQFLLLETIIKKNSDLIFPGLEIINSNTFRVTRDADIEISEDEAEDLMQEIEEQIKERKWAKDATRLEVSSRMPNYLVELLMNHLDLTTEDVYVVDRPLKLTDFMKLLKIDNPDIKDKPFSTRTLPELKNENIFEVISKQDLLVHHPFDSFTNSTLRLLNSAATDPDVVSIKITLYRTSGNSSIVAALKTATENGKQVTAFVELKARFDEENNIIWAKQLERAGVNVVYGIIGYKTHCKIALIIRRESNELKSYLHLGTGNYHEGTARLYTDMALFTSNPDFGNDAINLFNFLTGVSKYSDWKYLIPAPNHLFDKIIYLINREAEYSTPENPGLIFVKMNQLAQRDVIKALYRASMKGVQIKIICRGLCCLKPAIPGISENIEVRSIIGRFLEHSRIFYFKNNGNEEVFISSADWMSRNLIKRVELFIPVINKKLQKQIIKVLDYYWKDNTKSHRLLNDGTYEKIKPVKGEKRFNTQNFLLGILNRNTSVE